MRQYLAIRTTRRTMIQRPMEPAKFAAVTALLLTLILIALILIIDQFGAP